MKIFLMNGSPKAHAGASSRLLEFLEHKLGAGHTYVRCISASTKPQEILEGMSGCEAIVVAFPLYVDGVPSHLLRLLASIESSVAGAAPGSKFYAVVNNGYFEARQNQPALDILRNFCDRAGLVWGQGVGIGGGGMIVNTKEGSSLIKSLDKALDALAQNIRSGRSSGDLLPDPDVPRFMYMFGGNMSWKGMAKKNGLRLKK